MTQPGSTTPSQFLPDGSEIESMRASGRTFADIGEQYGVSRQAVHKALNTWRRRQALKNEEKDVASTTS